MLIGIVVDAALRTFVLPRGAVVRLTRAISVVISRVFELILRPARTYETRDRVMALYAPVVLMAMVVVWLVLLIGAFTMIFLAIEGKGVSRAFSEAGSSLFTLGFERPHGDAATVVAFMAASFGLGPRRPADRVPPDHLRVVLAAGGAGRVPRTHARARRRAPSTCCGGRTSSTGSTTSTTSGTATSCGSPSSRRRTRHSRCSTSSGRRRPTGRG